VESSCHAECERSADPHCKSGPGTPADTHQAKAANLQGKGGQGDLTALKDEDGTITVNGNSIIKIVERHFRKLFSAPGGCKTGARGYKFGCLEGRTRIQHHLASVAYADDLSLLTEVAKASWSKVELAVVLEPLHELGITDISQNSTGKRGTSWMHPRSLWERTG
jgi:hypothetical protein